ncbi:MAG: BMP family ABC transporter substrate-binding protein [Fimbriimonadales bacterium]
MKYAFLSVMLAALMLAGCGEKKEGSSGSAGRPSPENGLAIVFDKGGVGDKSFNDSADRGRARAEQELGMVTKTVSSRSDIDYKPNLEDLARLGFKLIIAVGGGMQKAVEEVAPKYPDVYIGIIDGHSNGLPNVIGVRFKEEEGSFLAGVLAGSMTKSNVLGFVGGMKIPLIEKFECGFAAGVKAVNPSARVVAKYTEDWDNIGKGKEAALACRADGADIIYHAAGKCGLGVFDAAQEKGFYAIGVDSDQDGLKPGIILTSMIKGVDEQVFRLAQMLKNGELKGGDIEAGLAEGGVGLSEMKHTKDKIGPAVLAKVDQFKQRIISGELKVPKTQAELAAFRP